VRYDPYSSLEELEGVSWGEPTYDSYVVTTSHALRKKPLNRLTDEELRLGLSQQIGLDFLTLLAIERLSENPLRSGDFYPGDMLVALMRISPDAWANKADLHRTTTGLAKTVLEIMENTPELEDAYLRKACETFLASGH
jgi:hypothetical protein